MEVSAIASVASWLAPAATMIAAMMTAANLGARVTGWGFIVFTIGSVGWAIIGIDGGQSNLLWTNGFLTLVNAIGVWRWLGREARYAREGSIAATKSVRAQAPNLFAVGALSGAKVIGPDGESIGTIVEAMIRCSDARIAYVVISEGGVNGIGERLHAVDPAQLSFAEDGVKSLMNAGEVRALRVLEDHNWPATVSNAPAAPTRA